MKSTFVLLVLFLSASMNLSCGKPEVPQTATSPKLIIGYVPGFRGELDETMFDARKITHINYAFVNIKDSMAWLTNIATDTINFRRLNNLKKINPDLKILISIGGWSWSENFSDAVLTESSRKKFATTSVDIVRQYELDGVDIDWEYPGQKGEDNIFRAEDKENFTHMFVALRDALDQLESETGKKYLLTSAVTGSQVFIQNTEMKQAAEPQDFINVMCYDYYVGGPVVGHHSNLYPPEDFEKDHSADKDMKNLMAAGVPAEKLVMGLPFYGRSWIMQSAEKHGINMPRDSVARAGGYTFIKDSMMTNPAFEQHWDERAQAPYLFNSSNNQLVVYDDEESVRIKCGYVKENNLAGVMFWQYLSDPKEYLLDAVNAHLK
jgi:chitinase